MSCGLRVPRPTPAKHPGVVGVSEEVLMKRVWVRVSVVVIMWLVVVGAGGPEAGPGPISTRSNSAASTYTSLCRSRHLIAGASHNRESVI